MLDLFLCWLTTVVLVKGMHPSSMSPHVSNDERQDSASSPLEPRPSKGHKILRYLASIHFDLRKVLCYSIIQYNNVGATINLARFRK